MPLEFAQNWVRDRAVENRVEDVRNPGEYNATTWDKFAGFLTGTNVDKAVDDHTQKVNNKEVTDYLTSIGETRESLGLSKNANVNQASGAFTRISRDRADEKSETQFNRNLQASMAPITAQLQQSSNEFNQTMQRTLAQDARNYQLQLQTAADAKEARADELEFRRMEARREDQRYNERMEQLDRKDRRQAMSSIAAGLASLGAAFAM